MARERARGLPVVYDYTVVNVVSPLDGSIIPAYNLNPAKRGQIDRTDVNSTDRSLRRYSYNGFEFGTSARFGSAQFFGGWTFPGLMTPADALATGLLHIGIFIGKMLLLMLVFIWVRWMLPRFRYDQLMDLGWRRFIPLALANILVYATWLWAKS